MRAWLNYASIRAICGEWGFIDFGPYWDLPAEEAAEKGNEAIEVQEFIEEVVAKNVSGGNSFSLLQI